MAPIPLYSGSPINAAKASGVTPKTADPEPSDSAPPTTTSTSSTNSSYPAAQPGAASVPAPTGSAQRYIPVQPTPTTASHSEGPPAPQPGAAPVPPKSHVHPPPKAGEMYQPQQQQSTVPRAQPYPPQMGVPPPTTSYGVPPHSSTSANTASSLAYPVQLQSGEQGGPRRSIEHPPGYHQNAYASEMTSDQRRAQDAHNASSGGFKDDDNSEGIWNSAKKMAQNMGTKIAETEAEVWRRVSKE